MKALILLLLMGILFTAGNSHSLGSKAVDELVVKTELSTDQVKKGCDLYEVDILRPIRCTDNDVIDGVVPHGTNCTFKHKQQPEAEKLDEGLRRGPGTVQHLVCNDGHWSGTDYSVGQPLDRNKRFLGIFLKPLIGVAFTIACNFLCPKPDPETGEPVVYHPPTFEKLICKPNEIQDNYYVEADKRVSITWTAPEASDKNGGKPTVQQSGGKENGGQFEGSVGGKTHQITYTAVDNTDLKGFCSFTIIVTEATCASPQWPSNGQRYCDDFRVGKQCQYQCHPGYEIQGDEVLTCENAQSPTWSSAAPTCTKVTCGSPPTSPTNGAVSCADTTYSYHSFCFYKCDDGFSLIGQTYTQCQSDGSWFENAAAITECIDDSPPSINCKSPQIFYADRGASSTSVTYEIPTATDPTDEAPVVVHTSGPSLGDVISVGSEYVTYRAEDFDGNRSPECTIELRVQEITCPHPLDTFQGSFLQAECSGTSYTYGVECTLSCSLNLPLNGSDLITCEDNGQAVGQWEVAGGGSDPYCREIACPELRRPINGALVYDTVLTRPIYTMVCMNTFDIPYMGSSFSGTFFCTDSGIWNPSTVPDCENEIKFFDPSRLKLHGELYYYSGFCNTTEAMTEIAANFQTILATVLIPNYNIPCPVGDTCTAENIVIKCGEIDLDIANTDRRKRSSGNPAINKIREKRAAGHLPNTREKRQTEDATLVIELDIVVTVTIPEGETIFDHIDYYDAIVTALSSLTEELYNNGSLDIPNFTTRNDSWVAPYYAAIECETGYVLDGAMCKPCPSGHYLNETSTTCIECPIGQYSGEDAVIECFSCPTGYSTKEVGSKSLDNCTELCGPGTISPDGMMPCSTCLYGEYQDNVGQTMCKQCPSGTTTKSTNSSSSDDCQNYDILIEDTSGPISLTNITSTMTLMFWTKRVDEQSTSTIFQLQSDGDDKCIIYLTDNFRVQVPNGIDETIGELYSDKWTHQAIVWNSDDNILEVYMDGVLEFTLSLSSSSSVFSNGELILTANGQSGLHMTGFYLYDRVLTASEIATHGSSSHVTSDNDVIGIDIFQDNAASGISSVAPSQCDAVDNCRPDPCNGHQCIDEQDNFTCYCNSGWSGDTCLTPPDYCTDNECTNGATCQSGASNYTCDCLPGYSGPLCGDAPVGGGWSEWVIESGCTQLCGSGSQTRTRSCDSPVPDLYGADCDGDDEDTISCNTQACQVCEDLPTQSGTLTSCMTNMTTGIRTCELYCEDDKIMPPGLPDYQEYACGSHTSYEWEHAETLPSCVEPTSPTRLEITTSIEYTASIPDGDIADLTDEILNNFLSTPCSDNCQANVQISDSGTTLTLAYSVDLLQGPELHIDEYIADGTVSGSLQELMDAVNYLELSAQHLQNYTADIFDVAVNGVTYSANTGSLTSQGVVTCPDGQVAHEGSCLKCPSGTYSDGYYCAFCEIGTYQPLTGQSDCIQCPTSLTTKSIGSTDLSKCSETLITATKPTYNQTPASEPESNTTLIVAVVIATIALLVACLAIALICYKKCRPANNVSDSRADMQRPVTARTRFRRQFTGVSFSTNTSSRPTSPGQISLRTDYGTGSDEARTRCNTPFATRPLDGGYVTPVSRISPPPPYNERDGLPEYSEKDENPYNSIIEETKRDSKTKKLSKLELS